MTDLTVVVIDVSVEKGLPLGGEEVHFGRYLRVLVIKDDFDGEDSVVVEWSPALDFEYFYLLATNSILVDIVLDINSPECWVFFPFSPEFIKMSLNKSKAFSCYSYMKIRIRSVLTSYLPIYILIYYASD